MYVYYSYIWGQEKAKLKLHILECSLNYYTSSLPLIFGRQLRWTRSHTVNPYEQTGSKCVGDRGE